MDWEGAGDRVLQRVLQIRGSGTATNSFSMSREVDGGLRRFSCCLACYRFFGSLDLDRRNICSSRPTGLQAGEPAPPYGLAHFV